MPCPPTPRRIELYREFATRSQAQGVTPVPFTIPTGLDPGSGYIVSKPSIAAERTRLLDSLIQVVEPSDIKSDLAEEAAGDGIKLIELIRDLAGDATPGDRALVRTEYDSTVSTGLAGAELTLKSFNDFVKRLLRANRHMHPSSHTDADLSMVLQQIIYCDSGLRGSFDIRRHGRTGQRPVRRPRRDPQTCP